MDRVEGQYLRRKGRGGTGMPIQYTVDQEVHLDPVDGGTRVTIKPEIDTKGLLKAAAPAVVRMSKHDQAGQPAHPKELIEGHEDVHAVLAIPSAGVPGATGVPTVPGVAGTARQPQSA